MADTKTRISLDSTLDDLEDLAGFDPLLSGAYLLDVIKIEEHEVDNLGQCISFRTSVNAVVELSETVQQGDPNTKPGDKADFMFQMGNPNGRAFFKKAIMPIAEKLGTKQVGQAMEQAAGIQILVTVVRTWNKEKGRHYTNLKSVVVP